MFHVKHQKGVNNESKRYVQAGAPKPYEKG